MHSLKWVIQHIAMQLWSQKAPIEHRACYNTYMKEFASVVHWGIEQKTSGKLLYN